LKKVNTTGISSKVLCFDSALNRSRQPHHPMGEEIYALEGEVRSEKDELKRRSSKIRRNQESAPVLLQNGMCF